MALAALIHENQGVAVSVPTLEIVNVPVSDAQRKTLLTCADCHAVVFVSRNAVVHANAIAPLASLAMRAVFAPGVATADALEDVGVDDVITPDCGNDSESLLALPQLQNIGGKHVLIVRGLGGRDELRDKLVGRDARVDYVEVYRRRPPADCHDNLRLALAVGVDAICVGSGEAMENLLSCLSTDETGSVLRLPLFAPSQRVAELARARGFKQPVVTDAPDDQSTTCSLLKWAAMQKPVEADER